MATDQAAPELRCGGYFFYLLPKLATTRTAHLGGTAVTKQEVLQEMPFT